MVKIDLLQSQEPEFLPCHTYKVKGKRLSSVSSIRRTKRIINLKDCFWFADYLIAFLFATALLDWQQLIHPIAIELSSQIEVTAQH